MSTPLLGLALPADGTTNWGTLVNTSITALLDSAVAGTTTLTSDADVTLTTTAEASNQARQSVLLCSGARTALRTVTAPAQSKTYVVINNTSGGFGVKIVGVGPTTGVTIPAGSVEIVAWNGADFVKAYSDYVTTSTAQTLTNKRVTPRIGSVTSASTITPTGDSSDQYNVTALAVPASVAAPSGTPTDGQKLILRLEDDGTARALTWTTTSGAYRAIGTTLPTTTVATKTTYVGCIYNATDVFWDVVAVTTQA
jgi:hypothetical protein